jgi:hypothetical protein
MEERCPGIGNSDNATVGRDDSPAIVTLLEPWPIYELKLVYFDHLCHVPFSRRSGSGGLLRLLEKFLKLLDGDGALIRPLWCYRQAATRIDTYCVFDVVKEESPHPDRFFVPITLGKEV